MKVVRDPTVGASLWYWPSQHDLNLMRQLSEAQPLHAVVTFVINSRKVDLVVFDHIGVAFRRAEVQLLHGEETHRRGVSHAAWPTQEPKYHGHLPPEADQPRKAAEPQTFRFGLPFQIGDHVWWHDPLTLRYQKMWARGVFFGRPGIVAYVALEDIDTKPGAFDVHIGQPVSTLYPITSITRWFSDDEHPQEQTQ